MLRKSKADEILKLSKLVDRGILTEEEFLKEKQKILNDESKYIEKPQTGKPYTDDINRINRGREKKARTNDDTTTNDIKNEAENFKFSIEEDIFEEIESRETEPEEITIRLEIEDSNNYYDYSNGSDNNFNFDLTTAIGLIFLAVLALASISSIN